MPCASCFGSKKSRQDDPASTQAVKLNHQDSSNSKASSDTKPFNTNRAKGPDAHSTFHISPHSDPPIVTRGDSEISLRWDPFILDREDLDRELCGRMSWNVSGKGVEKALIAVTKFKIMATRAQAAVEKRAGDGEPSPIVNSLRNVLAISAAAASSRTASSAWQLDEDTEAEIRQIQAREDRIDEGRRLLHQRLKLLKLREVHMEVLPASLPQMRNDIILYYIILYHFKQQVERQDARENVPSRARAYREGVGRERGNEAAAREEERARRRQGGG
jgi:hypothetical protein